MKEKYNITEHRLRVLQRAVIIKLEYEKHGVEGYDKDRLDEMLLRLCSPRGRYYLYDCEQALIELPVYG